jgi:hypothetical protein
MHRLTLIAAAAASVLAFPLDAAEPQPFALRAEAKVEIDPSGKLVRVESTQDLPPAVRAYIEKQVATWQFKRNDANPTANASTWIYLHACGLPVAGGYTMGLAYHGNGPRVSGTGWRTSRAIARAVGRSGWDGAIKVHYVVNPDGSASLESVEGLPGEKRDLHEAIEQWIEGFTYDPEMLDGKPVATRGVLPVEFRTDGNVPTKQDLVARAVQSPACRNASMGAAGTQAVAVDSNIGVVPSI